MARAGRLHVYLGAAPGVGKTYAMLAEGRHLAAAGQDVVVGFAETYGRPGTEEQLGDLEIVPRRTVHYRGLELEELDLDAVLTRRPALALVDELAHTNAPGSRHTKRWQDVAELLRAGVDVATTLNIQHLESLNDVVEQITGIHQHEQIPDAVVRAADRIDLVDLSPEALRQRLADGQIYRPERVDIALDNYFRAGNLGALRELALLWLADRVEEELADYRARHGIRAPWETKERIMVALSGAPHGEHLIRRGARTAARVHGDLIGVHVRIDDATLQPEPPALDAQRRLLRDLHGSYVEVAGLDIARTLVDFARSESATQLLLGASGHTRLREVLTGSVINRVIRLAGPIDIRVLPPARPGMLDVPRTRRRPGPLSVPSRRLLAGWILGPAGAVAVAALLSPLRPSLGLSDALLCLLLMVAAVARWAGRAPAVATTLAAATAADFFFTAPVHSLAVDRTADVVALLVFLAVAGLISTLIDRLSRRSQQAARSRAEAEALIHLAGDTVRSGARALPDLVAQLRRTFQLEAAAVLTPAGADWHALASAGSPVPVRPEDAPFAAELDQGAVLVLVGPALSDENTRLLGPFVTQLRLAQERERLTLAAAAAESLTRTDALHTTLLEAVLHDLRTPLAVIKDAATRLMPLVGRRGQPPEARRLCAAIGTEADRLAHLTANLLGLSRLHSGQLPETLRPTVLRDVLREAIAGLPVAAGTTTAVAVDIPADLPPVEADPGLLERALANIIANARTWSPPDTPVHVDAGAVGGQVRVRITDRGPGITADQRDNVFQPFRRTDAPGDGRTGDVTLGLAVAKGFTEAMHGELTVEETPGGGATFVLSLRALRPGRD